MLTITYDEFHKAKHHGQLHTTQDGVQKILRLTPNGTSLVPFRIQSAFWATEDGEVHESNHLDGHRVRIKFDTAEGADVYAAALNALEAAMVDASR